MTQDNVLGLGPPIRVFRFPQRRINEAGVTEAYRERTPRALLSLWDGGFYIYDFEVHRLDGSEKELAAENRERVIRELCKTPDRLLYGELSFGSKEKVISFDRDAEAHTIVMLKGYLCRTFGYESLQEEAMQICKHNPLVRLNFQSLGHLTDIIEARKREWDPMHSSGMPTPTS